MGLKKTLAELETMDQDELIGWMAFSQLEPWGCQVEDQRTEMGLRLLYAINSKPNAKIPRFIDRDPDARASHALTDEDLEDNIAAFFAGRTIKKEAEPEQPARKPRKDKGTKRGPRKPRNK